MGITKQNTFPYCVCGKVNHYFRFKGRSNGFVNDNFISINRKFSFVHRKDLWGQEPLKFLLQSSLVNSGELNIRIILVLSTIHSKVIPGTGYTVRWPFVYELSSQWDQDYDLQTLKECKVHC